MSSLSDLNCHNDLNFEYDSQFTVSLKQELLFVLIFILFIFSWISVEVVGRALNNFTFRTLKLDENSTFHTSVIAFVVLFIELTLIYYFKNIGIPIYDPIFTDNTNVATMPLNGSKKEVDSITKFITDGDRGIGNRIADDIFTIMPITGVSLI